MGLGMYFPPVNTFYKQKCGMCDGMSNPRELKVKFYDACLIDLNDYFDDLTRAKASNNIGEIAFNEVILNIIPNGWS